MRHTTILAALSTCCILTVGCSKDESPKPAPQKSTHQEDQQPNKKQEEPSQEAKESKNSNSDNSNVQVANSDSQHAQSDKNASQAEMNRDKDNPHSVPWGSLIENKLADAKDYVSNGASSTKDYLGDKASAIGAALRPPLDSVNRRDSMDESREASQNLREKNLEALRQVVLVTGPEPRSDVFSAVRPADETTTLLAALVSEGNPARIEPLTFKLIDEIFNEPEMARAKIMEVQLGIRHLSERNLYDKDTTRRVAYLQANLDQRIKDDQNADVLRDGLLIAGGSVAIGTVAGFHGLDRMRDVVHEYPRIGTMFKGGTSRAREAIMSASNGVRSLAARTSSAISSIKSIKRLPAEQVAERNLKALGVSDEGIRALDLVPVTKLETEFQMFNPTNLPGFRYAVSDTFDGVRLDTERVILFSLPRTLGVLGRRPVSSKKMTVHEAEDFIKSIEYKAPELGGREFAKIVDTDSGAVISTRIPSENIEAEFDTQLAESATHISPTRAEAEAEGIVPMNSGEEIHPSQSTLDETQVAAADEGPGNKLGQKISLARDKVSEASHNFAQMAKESVRDAASGSRRVYGGAVDAVKPALRSFDKSWALTAGAGSAIPLYGLYYSAYGRGHEHGQDYQTVYLESLVPDERLSQISLIYEEPPQRGQ